MTILRLLGFSVLPMIDQTFSTHNLLKLVNRLDPSKYKLGRSSDDYEARIAIVSQAISSDNFKFSRFDKALRAGKPVYTASTCNDEFAIRKLNDNIRRLYKVIPANRHEVIGQVKLLLEEKLPYYVVRLDIKDFYESINRKSLIDRLCSRSLLGYRSKKVLHALFQSPQFKQHGVPRGISLSSTLSEIYLHDFDTAIRRMSGVYYYARYVDDIILFSIAEPTSLLKKISAQLPVGMSFHPSKYEIVEFNEKGNCASFIHNPFIDYLGYRFQFRQQKDVPITGKPLAGAPPLPPRLIVKIAENKVKKIKQRIMLSLLDFIKTNDFALLFSRIRFLTSNTRMQRPTNDGTLLSGIYYSYSYIDERGVLDLCELSLFLRHAVFSQNCSFGHKLSTLKKSQRQTLGKFSFEAGHKNRVTHSVSARRLRQIKKCWHHV